MVRHRDEPTQAVPGVLDAPLIQRDSRIDRNESGKRSHILKVEQTGAQSVAVPAALVIEIALTNLCCFGQGVARFGERFQSLG